MMAHNASESAAAVFGQPVALRSSRRRQPSGTPVRGASQCGHAECPHGLTAPCVGQHGGMAGDEFDDIPLSPRNSSTPTRCATTTATRWSTRPRSGSRPRTTSRSTSGCRRRCPDVSPDDIDLATPTTVHRGRIDVRRRFRPPGPRAARARTRPDRRHAGGRRLVLRRRR